MKANSDLELSTMTYMVDWSRQTFILSLIAIVKLVTLLEI